MSLWSNWKQQRPLRPWVGAIHACGLALFMLVGMALLDRFAPAAWLGHWQRMAWALGIMVVLGLPWTVAIRHWLATAADAPPLESVPILLHVLLEGPLGFGAIMAAWFHVIRPDESLQSTAGILLFGAVWAWITRRSLIAQDKRTRG